MTFNSNCECVQILNQALICVRIREPYVYQEIFAIKRKNKKVKDSFLSILNSKNNI